MWGQTPPQTPPLRGEGLSSSPFPTREGGWGVRLRDKGQSAKSLTNSAIEQGGEFHPLLIRQQHL